MRNPWLIAKAFLYFGGAAVIIIGGIIVLMAPYNYVGFLANTGSDFDFEIVEAPGFYDQFTIIVRAKPANLSVIIVDLAVIYQNTSEVTTVNMTLTSDDLVPNSNPPVYMQSHTLSVRPGNYTIVVERLVGVSWIDLSFKQATESKTFAMVGGMLNIIGLVMAIAGYFLPGSFLPSSEYRVVGWGYDTSEEDESQQ